MPHPFSIVKPEQVTDRDALQQFIQQQLGVGYVTNNDQAIYRRKLKELFEHEPRATWATMISTVEWAKTRRKRFSRLYQVIESVRYAYEDGFLPELDTDTETLLDEQIREVLQTEDDPNWRRKLLVAQGSTAKSAMLDMWYRNRQPNISTLTD